MIPQKDSGPVYIISKNMINPVEKIKGVIIEFMLFFRFSQKIIGRRWFVRWNHNYILAEKELSFLPLLLNNESVVFDIGANRGELSYFFAVACKALKVYSFEPQNRMFGVLLGVAENVRNIEPINLALSDSNGEKILRIPFQAKRRYTQAASLEEKSENTSNEKVRSETLDDFVIRNGIQKLDFIKCDTEGHELAVFAGSKKTLLSLHPLLYVEIKDSNVDPVFKLLKSLHYNPYRWDYGTSSLVTAKDGQKIKSENYYFLPLERELQILSYLAQR